MFRGAVRELTYEQAALPEANNARNVPTLACKVTSEPRACVGARQRELPSTASPLPPEHLRNGPAVAAREFFAHHRLRMRNAGVQGGCMLGTASCPQRALSGPVKAPRRSPRSL